MGEFAPLLGFGGEFGAAFGGEGVEASFAIVFGESPLGGEEFAIFEALEGEIEGAVVDEEGFFGLALDDTGYALSVAATGGEGAEDEQVECSLKERGAVGLLALGRHPR